MSVATGVSVRGVSRRIVTEHMLLAGEAVAWFADAANVPMPYRAQSMNPEADSLDTEGEPEPDPNPYVCPRRRPKLKPVACLWP